MPTFKVLFIKEFDSKITSVSSKESDHRIVILYDKSTCSFYYYGTRSRDINIKKKFIEYSGSYSYDAFHNFHDFLKYLMDGECALITTELYDIHIGENEYSQLSFSKINGKFCGR